jgi:hypothetical protein
MRAEMRECLERKLTPGTGRDSQVGGEDFQQQIYAGRDRLRAEARCESYSAGRPSDPLRAGRPAVASQEALHAGDRIDQDGEDYRHGEGQGDGDGGGVGLLLGVAMEHGLILLSSEAKVRPARMRINQNNRCTLF